MSIAVTVYSFCKLARCMWRGDSEILAHNKLGNTRVCMLSRQIKCRIYRFTGLYSPHIQKHNQLHLKSGKKLLRISFESHRSEQNR